MKSQLYQLYASITIKAEDVKAPTAAANETALQNILGTVYLWVGIICVFMIIIGGVRYITSNGDSSGIQSAKNTIMYSVAGLIVVIAAAGITQFIIGRF